MSFTTVHVVAEAYGIVFDPPGPGEELSVVIHSNTGYMCLLLI